MQAQTHVDETEESLIGEKSEEPPGTGLILNAFPPSAAVIHLDDASARLKRPPKTRPETRAFRKRFYPATSDKQWHDWRWQIANRISSPDHLARLIHLTQDERAALSQPESKLPLGVTPYYASLISAGDPNQPLRRTVVPVTDEFVRMACEADDPLHEEEMSPVPGLVHRYPDRVLLLVCDFCGAYCRY